jgi:two-component system, LytTR family, sensor kinase
MQAPSREPDPARANTSSPEVQRAEPYALAAVALLAAWVVVLLVFSVRLRAIYTLENMPMPWRQAFAASAVDWVPWLVFAPLAAWISSLVPLSRERYKRAIVVHAAAALSITVVHALLRPYLAGMLGLTGHNSFAVHFLMLLQLDPMLYAVITGAGLAARYARELRGRERAAAASELRTAQLEQTLAESRLSLLRTQLDPHFLFNTMHGVSALMHEDPEAADAMLTRLGDLLRASMNEAAPHEVTLEEELDFSERYLGIQRARFGSRLQTTLHIRPEALQARVPSMMLQPLLENAIRHGIAPRYEGGCLEVQAFVDGRTLRIFVRDDGVGLPGVGHPMDVPVAPGSGIGLRNTVLRLKQMYGDTAALEMRRREPAGTEVAVSLPFTVVRDGVVEGRGGPVWAARVR